ncbi:hypothetical protein GCM10007079_04030 [Nocardiopsis terrae]|uniref:Uncharacterized protein n=1 Tax=Nocardiopsis terrae TaxID=372655 RepID=A0ABR9HN93_9ACTN|nr:hypothetical protein [Nocardiopsis terrae]MBE1460454.1 hypothetical protein [Nocardiopsis terrae]GHC71551.1 hypothetical protein GCM10007079_04030 [Nocardiopsis terrae]
MSRNSHDRPSEIELLRQRLLRLEARAYRQEADAPRERARAAAFAAGAVALFLSMALPWVRDGGGLRFVDDGVVSSSSLNGYATGWDLFGAAAREVHWPFALAFVVLLLLLLFSLGCFKEPSKGVLVTTVVLCVLTPALCLLGWFPSLGAAEDSMGSGVFVMLMACVVIGSCARGMITDGRFDS